MKIQLLEEAENDLALGEFFYVEQSPDAGSHFYQCLTRDLQLLETIHGFHLQQYGYHRALSEKFPYSIYYEMSAEEIIVVAVLDQRHSPQKIRKILNSRTSKS